MDCLACVCAAAAVLSPRAAEVPLAVAALPCARAANHWALNTGGDPARAGAATNAAEAMAARLTPASNPARDKRHPGTARNGAASGGWRRDCRVVLAILVIGSPLNSNAPREIRSYPSGNGRISGS